MKRYIIEYEKGIVFHFKTKNNSGNVSKYSVSFYEDGDEKLIYLIKRVLLPRIDAVEVANIIGYSIIKEYKDVALLEIKMPILPEALQEMFSFYSNVIKTK